MKPYSNMNILLMFVSCINFLQTAVKSSNDWYHYENEPVEFCIQKLNLDYFHMRVVADELNTSEDNFEYGNFFHCLWNKRGVINADGTINQSGFKLYVEKHTSRNSENSIEHNFRQEIFQNCKDVQGNTNGKTAIKLKNCVLKYILEYYS